MVFRFSPIGAISVSLFLLLWIVGPIFGATTAMSHSAYLLFVALIALVDLHFILVWKLAKVKLLAAARTGSPKCMEL